MIRRRFCGLRGLLSALFVFSLLPLSQICLCLPCIIYFMVRFAVRPADRQPTPPSLIQQLEVKTYADLIENLKRQYSKLLLLLLLFL